MPFDGLPQGLLSDMARLRVALDGVRNNWQRYTIGTQDAANHCAIGWLLAATDWDRDEATRLAVDYVYPALPEKAQKPERLKSIYTYNDGGGLRRVERLFEDAITLAERAVVR